MVSDVGTDEELASINTLPVTPNTPFILTEAGALVNSTPRSTNWCSPERGLQWKEKARQKEKPMG